MYFMRRVAAKFARAASASRYTRTHNAERTSASAVAHDDDNGIGVVGDDSRAPGAAAKACWIGGPPRVAFSGR